MITQFARLQHTHPGPGQALAIQAHTIAKKLQAQDRQPTIQWVPGHAGVEGNERADQAAKQAANKPPGRGSKEISLAFAQRARTEAITVQKQRWLARKLSQQSQRYRPQRNWQLDPLVAAAPKHLASRYFQLKSGHAATGTYLHQIQAREDATCQGCGSSKETVHHFLFECRQWRHQRNRLYKDLETDGVMRPTTAEEYPQGRLLGEPKATRALLQFLASTSVALPQGYLQRAVERAWKDEE